MPVVALIDGIVIRMYFMQSEHNPPHVHVLYGEYSAAVDIRTQLILDGLLPARTLHQAGIWIAHHEAELLDMWNTQRFYMLP